MVHSGPGYFNLFRTQKKKKKAVAMVKHRKPCAQTQEYPKYTQTAVEIQKPLCTNTRASKINTQVSMLIP